MKTSAIILIATLFATPAFAGLPKHSGAHGSAFASRIVCQTATFKTAPVPNKGNITISASVDGKQIRVIGGSGSHALDLSGQGVLVRVIQDPRHRAGLTIRAASVRNRCVRVNVLAGWNS